MGGTKATALAEHCRARGHSFLRFDYFGHGASSGEFRAGSIGRWAEDALAVIDELTEGPQILVGSSMGGWIALLAALARPDRIRGLIGIASRPRLHRGSDLEPPQRGAGPALPGERRALGPLGL